MPKDLKEELSRLGGKEIKMTSGQLDPDDPAVKMFNEYAEAERRRKRNIKMHLTYVSAQIEEFNSTKDVQQKKEIFEYFLECPVLCEFVFENIKERVRSDDQIRLSPPIGCPSSKKLILQGQPLIIRERKNERVKMRWQTSGWTERKKIPLSEIQRVEKKHYVEDAYTLFISLD